MLNWAALCHDFVFKMLVRAIVIKKLDQDGRIRFKEAYSQGWQSVLVAGRRSYFSPCNSLQSCRWLFECPHKLKSDFPFFDLALEAVCHLCNFWLVLQVSPTQWHENQEVWVTEGPLSGYHPLWHHPSYISSCQKEVGIVLWGRGYYIIFKEERKKYLPLNRGERAILAGWVFRGNWNSRFLYLTFPILCIHVIFLLKKDHPSLPPILGWQTCLIRNLTFSRDLLFLCFSIGQYSQLLCSLVARKENLVICFLVISPDFR